MTLTKYPAPDLFVQATATVGEGPVLDDRTAALCWVDIEQGQLHETALGTRATQTTSVEMMLGAAAPRATDSGFAAAVEAGFGFIVDGTLTVTDPVLAQPHLRMNDGKCDSQGRMWAGSNDKQFQPGLGRLHCWDGHGPSRVCATGLILPNGLGWDAADQRMYLVDSFAHTLMAAPYDGDSLTGPFAAVADVPEGLPDGLAVDVDGCAWVAIWGGWCVTRFAPTGEAIGTVPMPVAQPSSCAFGVDGTLYITSARSGIDPIQLARQPLAGSVFAVDSKTTGVPIRPFAA